MFISISHYVSLPMNQAYVQPAIGFLHRGIPYVDVHPNPDKLGLLLMVYPLTGKPPPSRDFTEFCSDATD